MPIFEFRCLGCDNRFEKLFILSNEKVDLACPKCHSEILERVVSRPNPANGTGHGGNRPKITAKSCQGGSNHCMTLDLPGHTK